MTSNLVGDYLEDTALHTAVYTFQSERCARALHTPPSPCQPPCLLPGLGELRLKFESRGTPLTTVVFPFSYMHVILYTCMHMQLYAGYT